MANGAFADRNRIARAVLDETGWSAGAPLANAKTLPLKVVARSQSYGTESSPVTIRGIFDERMAITYAGLFDTNMRQSGYHRLRTFADDGFTELLFDSRDQESGVDERVIPSLSDWRTVRWGADNLFRCDLEQEDFDLFQANIHMRLPLHRPKSFEWSIVDVGRLPDNADAGYIQVGHLWFSDSTPLEINYGYNGGPSANNTDEVTRTPDGGVWIEPGTGFRSMEIPLDYIRSTQSDDLWKMINRIRGHKPVVWIPNMDNKAEMFMYGFLGWNPSKEIKITNRYHDVNGATLNISEITA